MAVPIYCSECSDLIGAESGPITDGMLTDEIGAIGGDLGPKEDAIGGDLTPKEEDNSSELKNEESTKIERIKRKIRTLKSKQRI